MRKSTLARTEATSVSLPVTEGVTLTLNVEHKPGTSKVAILRKAKGRMANIMDPKKRKKKQSKTP